MIRACLAVLLGTAIGLSAGGVALAAEPEPPDGPESMVDAINEVRARHDLAPLRRDPSLCRSSRAYARRLIETGAFGHADSIRAAGSFSRLGEVLAMHRGAEARRRNTVQRWLGSPSHRALILSPAFRFAGAGRDVGRFWGAQTTIWVVQLGSR